MQKEVTEKAATSPSGIRIRKLVSASLNLEGVNFSEALRQALTPSLDESQHINEGINSFGRDLK